jgi:hypothetical protein
VEIGPPHKRITEAFPWAEAPLAPGVGQRRPARTMHRAIRDHRHHTNLVRIASSLRADMIFRKNSSPAIVPAGMMGDRADVIFASPDEISGFITRQC